MKSRLVSVSVALLLFSAPLFVSAQSANTPPAELRTALIQQLIAVYSQLIQLLEQEIASLQMGASTHTTVTPSNNNPATTPVPLASFSTSSLNNPAATIDQALSTIQAIPYGSASWGEWSIPGFSGTAFGTSAVDVVVRVGSYTGPTSLKAALCTGTSQGSQYCPSGVSQPMDFNNTSVSAGRWQTQGMVGGQLLGTLTVLVYDATATVSSGAMQEPLARTTITVTGPTTTPTQTNGAPSAVPSLFALCHPGGTATFSWTPVAGATGYYLFVSDASATTYYGPNTGTSYSNSTNPTTVTVPYGQKLLSWIYAYNDYGQSAFTRGNDITCMVGPAPKLLP